jgi:hypothetical protein
VYSDKKIFCLGLTRAAKVEQKSIVPERESNEQTKEGSLSFVLFESSFTSVSTVSRGLPSLVSMVLATALERVLTAANNWKRNFLLANILKIIWNLVSKYEHAYWVTKTLIFFQ